MTDEKRTYQALPLAQKQALHRDRMREPAIACPFCEVQVTVDGMLRHECAGKREVHPLEEWIEWAAVMKLGIPEGTFHRWVKAGRVERRGERPKSVYRRRDVAKMIMYFKWRWRTSTDGS